MRERRTHTEKATNPASSSSLPFTFTTATQSPSRPTSPSTDDHTDINPLLHFKLDLDPLTSTNARNQTIHTLTTNVGTIHSRNGKYVRPTWRDDLRGTCTRSVLCFLLVMIVLGLSGFQVIMSRGGTKNITVDGIFNSTRSSALEDEFGGGVKITHDYSGAQSAKNFNSNNVDHWCLFPSASPSGDCDCKSQAMDPLIPRLKDSKDWKNAHELNKELAMKAAMTASHDKNDPEGQVDIVFLGDSITEEWNGRWHGKTQENLGEDMEKTDLDEIHDIFTSKFKKNKGASLEAIALGIAGDTCPNLLWRIQNGELPEALNPKLFWLLIGTNDLSYECSEEVILIGILRIVQELLDHKPDSLIVINGILPRTVGKDGLLHHVHPNPSSSTPSHNEVEGPTQDKLKHKFDYWPSIQGINRELKSFSLKHDRVEFFDGANIFLGSVSNAYFERSEKILIQELMEDFLHPSKLGHSIWADAIEDYIASDLNMPHGLLKH